MKTFQTSLQELNKGRENLPFFFNMKIYNSVGCTIDGITEKEFAKFKEAGWMTEEEYKKIHPGELE